ncbi:MAG: cupredoxin family copper-binding protein [Actinomycetota bacterium]
MAFVLRAAALLAAAAFLPVPLAQAAGSGTRHTVTMEGTRFDPGVLTVRPGDTVVWVNRDPFPHTATARSGAFDSGSIDSGKSWKYRVGKAGTFDYFCAFHPTMKGVLKVE